MIAAVLDHLWQSTLFALAIGIVAALVRDARAGVRHTLWLTASLKFLVPFAPLEALGARLTSMLGAPAQAAPDAVFIARAAQPFSLTVAGSPAMGHGPVLLLALVWGLGAAVVMVVWMLRWSRIRRIVGAAKPLPWPAPMPVLASSSLMEPGLVGLWRPVLLVPRSLPDHLSQAEMDAIVAHETGHLRRGDNLTGALHMLVEALFWFHPLVWWIGVRMTDERERACDQAVVRSGYDRAIYARSLLKCCRLYLQSPLPCMAGASGSGLPARVQRIMTEPAPSTLAASSQAMMCAAAVCALASPITAGWLGSPGGQGAAAGASALISGLASGRPALSDQPFAAPSARTRASRPVRLAPTETLIAPDRPIVPTGPALSANGSPAPLADPAQSASVPAGAPAAEPIALAVHGSDPQTAAPDAHETEPARALATTRIAAASPGHSGLSSKAAYDDPDHLVCTLETVTGSRFTQRVCMTWADARERQRRLFEMERRWLLDPSGFSAAPDKP